jgi:hypothetical protein
MNVSYSSLHCFRFPPHYQSFQSLDNCLQLPCIAQRILDDLVARHHDIPARILIILRREVYPSILDHPPGLLRELDDAAFRVEEEERLGVRDGDGWVRFLAARGNLFSNGANEDLPKMLVKILRKVISIRDGDSDVPQRTAQTPR